MKNVSPREKREGSLFPFLSLKMIVAFYIRTLTNQQRRDYGS